MEIKPGMTVKRKIKDKGLYLVLKIENRQGFMTKLGMLSDNMRQSLGQQVDTELKGELLCKRETDGQIGYLFSQEVEAV